MVLEAAATCGGNGVQMGCLGKAGESMACALVIVTEGRISSAVSLSEDLSQLKLVLTHDQEQALPSLLVAT